MILQFYTHLHLITFCCCLGVRQYCSKLWQASFHNYGFIISVLSYEPQQDIRQMSLSVKSVNYNINDVGENTGEFQV